MSQDPRHTCPQCGGTFRARSYDIGSGPELSCPHCEWCWGAEGQPLKPIDVAAVRAELAAIGFYVPACDIELPAIGFYVPASDITLHLDPPSTIPTEGAS